MNALPHLSSPSNSLHSWQPHWTPENTDPRLPPITVIHDPHDQPAYTTTALAAHAPSHGQLTVHPTPLATAPAYLAHDLIRAQGKHLPLPDTGPPPYWLGNADASWQVAVAWTQALGISHYVICRAHRITDRHLEHLMALREYTRIRLTLVVSGPPTTALTDTLTNVAHHRIDTLETVRQHLHPSHAAPSATPYLWWEDTAFPGADHELWYQLPARPARPRVTPDKITATSPRSLGTRPPSQHSRLQAIPLPRLTGQTWQPSPHHADVARRIHSRIAHPVHATAVAIRALTGYGTDQLLELTAPTPRRARAELPSTLPNWAALLVQAARIYAALQGYTHPDHEPGLYWADRPFRLSALEQNDIAHATETCRLTAAPSRSDSKARLRKRR